MTLGTAGTPPSVRTLKHEAVIAVTEEERLFDFGCRFEETMRWLYATAASEVTDPRAAEVLGQLARAEAEHLAALEELFGNRLEDKRWSRPLGSYVRAHVLKTAAPRISSDDAAAVLKTAYALEVGSGKFYRRWRERNEDSDLDEVLTWFIEAESRHRGWVSQCHEELVGTPLADEGLDTELVEWPEL